MGLTRENTRVTADESLKQKKKLSMKQRNKGKTVHVASLMDLCQLKNSELEPKIQKFQGRIVLRGDIVKDDTGSHSVFTEQSSSASQMTAAKSNGCHIKATEMRRTGSRRNISVHPSQNGRCTDVTENSKVRMSIYMDTSTTTHVAQIIVKHGRPSRSS